MSSELDKAWADTQIEAMADGSLPPASARRLEALMAADPEIRAQVEQAGELRQQLRALRKQPVPRGLFARLWRIPEAERQHSGYWMPLSAAASVAVVALVAGVFLNTGPSPEDLEREAAVRDFTIAMAYLQKGTLMAQNEVNMAMGSGVNRALEVSRGVIDASQASGNEGE